MRLRRFLWLLLPLACIAIGATTWASLAPVGGNSKELVYVIPKGTWARKRAGEKFEAFPAEIRMTLGVKDILVLKNEDDVPQMFGPVLMMPGQDFRLPFQKASTYLFACSLHVNGQLTVVVDPMPEPGWARLRWRVAAIAKPGAWL